MSVLFLSRGGWYRGIKGGRDFSILQNKKSERINLLWGGELVPGKSKSKTNITFGKYGLLF